MPTFELPKKITPAALERVGEEIIKASGSTRRLVKNPTNHNEIIIEEISTGKKIKIKISDEKPPVGIKPVKPSAVCEEGIVNNIDELISKIDYYQFAFLLVI